MPTVPADARAADRPFLWAGAGLGRNFLAPPASSCSQRRGRLGDPVRRRALLGGIAGVFAYRLWRRPYEGPPEGKA